MPEVARTRGILHRLGKVVAEAGHGDAVALDRQLRELVQIEDELQRSLGDLLEAMRARGAWATLMFNGAGHYAEQRLGICRRTAEERARLSRISARFPEVGEAYRQGRIGSEAALLLARALGTSAGVTLGERKIAERWVARAEESSVKRLRDEVRQLSRRRWTGEDGPTEGPLDDALWHRSLEQRPGTIHARVARLALEAARLPEADGVLSLRLPASLAVDFLHTVEQRRSTIEEQVHAVAWDQPWPEPDSPLSVLVARLFSVRSRRVPAWVGLLALLEEFVATWDPLEGVTRRRADKIYCRDGWRCMAPGCTSRRNIEDHHVQYRSRGGGHDADNRVALCRFHHQLGEHGTLASCRGKAPLELTWRLGRADVAVWFRNELRIA